MTTNCSHPTPRCVARIGRAILGSAVATLCAAGLGACGGDEETPPPAVVPAPVPAPPAPGSAAGVGQGTVEPTPAPTAPAPAPTPAPETPGTTPEATSQAPEAPSAPQAPAPAAATQPGAGAAPAAASAGAKTRLLPVDAASRDSSLAEFRERLLQAVERKDREFLMSVLAPDVRVNFGGDVGPEAFREAWKLDSPDSPVWRELRDVLTRGGAFIAGGEAGDIFAAPYVYAVWPNQYDPAQYGAIVGEKVNVRKEPNLRSETVGQLTYDIVKIEPEANPPTDTVAGETYPWIRIRTLDDQPGYVFGKYVRSPLGYRAGFQKIDGQWKLTFFVTGD